MLVFEASPACCIFHGPRLTKVILSCPNSYHLKGPQASPYFRFMKVKTILKIAESVNFRVVLESLLKRVNTQKGTRKIKVNICNSLSLGFSRSIHHERYNVKSRLVKVVS